MAKEKNIKKPWYKNIILWIILLIIFIFGVFAWQVVQSTLNTTKYGTPLYRPKIID